MNPRAFRDLDRTISSDDEPSCEDSRIVRIAKLVLLLTSKDIEKDSKLRWLKLEMNNGLITQDEALDLLINLDELMNF